MVVHGIVAQEATRSVPRRLKFEMLRQLEYARLDELGHTYLDYAGAALFGRTQVERNTDRLRGEVLGNPHSESPASLESTERIERARRRVLEFLRADPAEYGVVFTANATGALRIVGEAFPFTSGSRLVMTADNHNSVNGIRCFAERAGARVHHTPLDDDLRTAEPAPWFEDAPKDREHLFVYPAQSNFSGIRHPLEWIANAQAAGLRVMLDASAYVPTKRLRLDRVRPDFLCISFYKMIGFPTGVGALIARHDALDLLRRPWFSGGTVDWVSTFDTDHALRGSVEAFEDGTPNFLAVDAVVDGLDFLDGIGMDAISVRTRDLTQYLLDGLRSIRHLNGTPVVELYGADAAERGGTVAFNVRNANGAVMPFDRVVNAAGRHRVSIRGGCFCNPGCAEVALRFDAARARSCRSNNLASFDAISFATCMGGPVGALRASVGIPTNERDIDRLIEVLEWCARSGTRP